MTTTQSATAQPDQAKDHDRDRELVRAITDALALAVGKQAAHRALRHARGKQNGAALGRIVPGRAVRAAALVAGYSALIGYIWREHRTSHHAAARPAGSREETRPA
jgi:hypothetical protein